MQPYDVLSLCCHNRAVNYSNRTSEKNIIKAMLLSETKLWPEAEPVPS